MSILGPSSMPALGLAGSAAAGAQRASGLTDRDQGDQAIRKLQADIARLSNRDLDDSVETDFSHGQVSDRDPDGRLPWQHAEARPEEGEAPPDQPVARVPMPDEERGRSLDVDA
jgi:hypothetical protein